MAGEVEAAGKGFLTAAGQVKDKKTLAAENQEVKKTQSNESEKAVEEDKSVSTAFKSVRTRFDQEVNSAISVVNQDQANLKRAGDNVKEQLKVAKELKEALKNENSEKADKKRAELQVLQEERSAIADQIDADNKRLAPDRNQSISLGNKQIEKIKTEKVRFESQKEAPKTESVEDVKKLISSLEDDRSEIKVQRQELREVKKQITGAVKEVRKELNSIEESSIRSIEEANTSAKKVASDIVKAGSQSALVSDIDESIVKELLAA